MAPLESASSFKASRGTPPECGCAGMGSWQFTFEFRPALNIETFLENAFAMLSERGPGTSLPMILEFSELMAHYRREFALAPAPLGWLTTLAAPVGKLVGYRPRFPVEA